MKASQVIAQAMREVLRHRCVITLANGKPRDIPESDLPELRRLNNLLDGLRQLKGVVSLTA